MKKIFFCIAALIIVSLVNGQGVFGKINKALNKDSSKKIFTGIVNSGAGKKSLSSEDIINGLKQALSVGTENTKAKLNKTDGFFKDAALKILMPAEAQKAEKTLRQFGMGNLVDKAVLSMNRAAEDAAGGISAIFIDAIKQMTIKDGLNILRGGDFAATDYLKKTTTAALTEKMRPIIESSLSKVNATNYWKEVFTNYNRLSFSKQPVNTDLSSYVTDKSMSGIFYSIGQEEQKIRKDPAAQVTDLLKKVFGK